MNEQILFHAGLALLTLHEMDAVRCREWRIFPGLSLLTDKVGQTVFLLAHIPLFFAVYRQLAHGKNLEAFMRGFNMFMLVHLVAHVLLLGHKNNEFKDWISWTIIIGAGLCGLTGLLV